MKWSVPALNICIPAQHEILTMGGTEGRPEEKFVIYTIEDAKELGKWIEKKVGGTQSKIEKKSKFRYGFWYKNEEIKDPKSSTPPSELLEEGYRAIPKWITKHQAVWDNAMDDDIIDVVDNEVDIDDVEAAINANNNNVEVNDDNSDASDDEIVDLFQM